MNNYVTVNIDKTLQQFLADYVLAKNITTQVFLDTKDEVGNTNWTKIQRRYSKKELSDNVSKYPDSSLVIKSGTQLFLPPTYIKRNIPKKIVTDTFNITEFKPFIAEQLAELMNDPSYARNVDTYFGEKIANVENNDITLYVWCRSLSAPGSVSQEGSWLNLSAFVDRISTRKDDVGSFNFSLPAIACEWDESKGWVLSDVIGYDSGDMRDDVLATTSLLKYNPKDPGLYYREKFLFNTVLQSNDLVFIKFEKLDIDSELEAKKRIGNRLSDTDIPNKVYDMIGLIDSVSINTTPRTASINVTGRDLMKMLIEDGSYFFPEQFAQNIFTDENSILTKRNKLELEAQSLAGASYTFKFVHVILKFIFNKFSNIGIIPNSAFNGYGQRAIRSKYQLKSSELGTAGTEVVDKLNESLLKEERQGVWRICEFIFDPQVAGRVLADNTISQDSGSILNSIRKVCQEPFIEFLGDTYKDKFYFFIRKQPFDAKGYRGLVYSNYVTETEGISSNTAVGVDDRQRDAINVRREVEKRLSTTGRAAFLSNTVIDIDDIDVMGEPSLEYHEEAYSWYRVIPRGLGVIDENSAFQLAPIVPFDEFAEIWGNRTMTMEYNYAPSEYLMDSGFESEAKYAETQTFYDLQFLIQSNQYLPFTRRGTITLTGNRLIKRGLFIFFKPTREVFYVDSVSHSRSVGGNNRTTTLQVSRGMREPYIKGKLVRFPSGEKKVSYFDIIRTDIVNNASINVKDFLKNWKVDKDVFNFFVQRRQWVD